MKPNSPYEKLFCYAFYADLEERSKVYYALIGDMKGSGNPNVSLVRSSWKAVKAQAAIHGLDIEPPVIEGPMPERYKMALCRDLLRHLDL